MFHHIVRQYEIKQFKVLFGYVCYKLSMKLQMTII